LRPKPASKGSVPDKYSVCGSLLQLLAGSFDVHAVPACAATLHELRALAGDPAFPLTWHETSMDDGKPLVVSIFEKGGKIHLEFVKTGEGLWAESAGVICATDAHLETHFDADQIRLGPAAGWVARAAFGNGGKFALVRLGSDGLRITTSGWSGMFSSRTTAK
jgi:hypothetical protein